MSTLSSRQIPGTPRVLSPSPDPPEYHVSGGSNHAPIPEKDANGANGSALKSRIARQPNGVDTRDPDYRARSRSRDLDVSPRKRRISGLAPLSEDEHGDLNGGTSKQEKTDFLTVPNGGANGHLSPGSVVQNYWREFSRSPSPLGIIPIHREWRSFIHRHEIPRKALHVSVGFLTLWLYAHGYQTSNIYPFLLGFLVPISLVDIIRHNYAPFNRFYIRSLGAFMRETEAHEKYNGVIWYLLGTYLVLRFTPKDVGVVCVCLLSWCDTAASTFGRLLGRYTPRIRKGKSLAGSLAAFVFGVGTAAVFWGWIGPKYEMLRIADNSGPNTFAFQGRLGLPQMARELLGFDAGTGVKTPSGSVALGLMSLWAGFVASASEAVDLFGWDDNITIPLLCGAGIWGFLKLFGSA